VKPFTVVWHTDVQDALAEMVYKFWGTSQLEQISLASNQVDKVLAQSPLEVGSSSAANLRYITIPPLTVLYAVFEEDRTVILLEYRLLFTNGVDE
jgi:hypothetical protein